MNRKNTYRQVPRVAIKSIGGGLFLMAFFTLVWNGIAESGFNGSDHYITTIIFSVFSLVFIIYGIFFFRISRKFPKISTDEEKSERKRISIWYGIIFGLEGITIPIVVSILLAFHSDRFIIPCIALIVGLHFYPMAKIFNRKIDYYLATWTCIIAIVGIILVKENTIQQSTVFSFVGVGTAIATTCYGIYMIRTAHLMINNLT